MHTSESRLVTKGLRWLSTSRLKFSVRLPLLDKMGLPGGSEIFVHFWESVERDLTWEASSNEFQGGFRDKKLHLT